MHNQKRKMVLVAAKTWSKAASKYRTEKRKDQIHSRGLWLYTYFRDPHSRHRYTSQVLQGISVRCEQKSPAWGETPPVESRGIRTDVSQLHALPQLSGLPLPVAAGNVTTMLHEAPRTLTQWLCMDSVEEKKPLQTGSWR